MSEPSVRTVDRFGAEKFYDQLRERGLVRKGSLTSDGCRCRANLEARRGTDKSEFLAALAESFPSMAAADLNAIGNHVLELTNGEIVIDFAFESLSDSYLFTHDVTVK